MKGVVFTEFLEYAESAFGADLIDDVIDAADLASGGAYTSVGTYPHQELIAVLVGLHEATGREIPTMVRSFGEHLFGRLGAAHGDLLEGLEDPVTFLENVDGVIHVTVRKLYPDAELPEVRAERTADGALVRYRSPRPFADLAEGLIQGCLNHFEAEAEIERETGDGETLFHVRLR